MARRLGLLAVLMALGLLYWPRSFDAPLARPRYTFEIKLDYAAHQLTARQHVNVSNTFATAVDQLVFNVPAAHTPGVFELQRVEVAGAQTAYTLTQTVLTVPLARTFAPGEQLTVVFDFVVRVPELNQPRSFGDANLSYTADVMSLGYWYPILAPYRTGQGWLAANWYPIGDPFLSEIADYEATITTAADVTVVAGGDLVRRGAVWTYTLPQARTLAFIVSDRYHTLSLPLGAVTYSVHVLPQHRALAGVTLRTMIQAVQLYTFLYGPYPGRSLRVAEFSGPWSMEFTGLVVLGASEFDDYDGTPRNRLVRITAHEVAHQWWYSTVGNDQINEPWLDEGLARYNEVRYYEAYAPQAMNWWWATVIGVNRPSAPLNSAVGVFNSHGAYLESIYNQGAVFLDALRTRLGDDNFNLFLRELYRRGSFRLITTADFLAVLRDSARVDTSSVVRRFIR